jgi:microcystin-dependent protein
MMKPLIAALFFLAASTGGARADTEPTAGEVDQFAFGFCPTGWHLTSGAKLKVKDYQELASVLGAKYGGDGVKTFALPQLVGSLTANKKRLTSCIALYGIYPTPNAVSGK